MDDPPTPDRPDAPSQGQERPSEAAQSEIRRLNRRLRDAEALAAALEASTSYQLGHSLVEAARSPRKVTRLGRELVRAWRSRAGRASRPRPTRGAAQVDSLAAWYQAIRASPERILLAHGAGAAGPRTRLVVAGVLRDETAAALGPDVWLHRLLPNEAVVALERADPDLVLIETGAFGAGRPWAYAGSPGVAERDLRLLEIVEAAHGMGRPTVLWWTAAAPEPVGLLRLGGRFDLVLGAAPQDGAAAWTPGVQLATFNDLGLDPARHAPPLFLGAWDPRLDVARRDRFDELLEAARLHDLEVLLDPRSLDGPGAFPAALRPAIGGTTDPATDAAARAYRAHPLVIGDPRPDGLATDRIREALACGARVVALATPDLETLVGDALHLVADGSAAAAELTAALQAGPRQPLDVRLVLRTLFQEHALPVRLAALGGRLGLRLDPCAGRRITVVVEPGPSDNAERLVRDMLGQAYRPWQVIVRGDPHGGLTDAAAQALREAGILVGPTPDGAAASWAAVAAEATAPWLTMWPAGTTHGRHHLLDLAMAAEASGADVVGYLPGGRSSFVSALPAAGSLVRREHLAADPLATGTLDDAWVTEAARHGRRLFGIAALDGGPAG